MCVCEQTRREGEGETVQWGCVRVAQKHVQVVVVELRAAELRVVQIVARMHVALIPAERLPEDDPAQVSERLVDDVVEAAAGAGR